MTHERSQITNEQRSKMKRYAWQSYTILAIIYLFVAFHRNSPVVLKGPIQETFNANTQEFALVTSFFFYPYLLMQLPAGILTDKFGPKRIVLFFTSITAIGSLLFGFSSTITMTYLARAMVGLGVSTVFIGLIKIQSTWFPSSKQAFMIGVTGIAANLGALCAQTPLVWLSEALGWRMTFIALGVITAIFVLLVALLVKEKPSDVGLPSMAELEGRVVNRQPVKVSQGLKSVLSNRNTWLAAFVFLGLYTGYIVLFGAFGSAFIQEFYQVELSQASAYLMIATVGALVAGLVIGTVSDSLKKRKLPIIVFMLLTLVAWVVFVYVKLPISLLMVLMFVLGFVMSAFVLCWTIANETNDPRFAGISSAVVNTIGYLGSAIAPSVMANIIDNQPGHYGYQQAFLVIIVLIAIGTVLSFFLPETNAENISGH